MSDRYDLSKIDAKKKAYKAELADLNSTIDTNTNFGLMNTLLGFGIPAAAVGAGIHYFTRKSPKASKDTLVSEEEKRKKAKRLNALSYMIDSSIKQRNPQYKSSASFTDILSDVVGNVKDNVVGAGTTAKDYLVDKYKENTIVNNHTDSALYYPAIALGLLGGSYAGYKGLQSYMDSDIKEKQLQHIEKRKRELDALLYDDPTTPELETTMEKQSGSGINKAVGAYLVLAGLIGTGGYLWGRGPDDERKDSRDAVKEFLAYSQTNQPLPIKLDTVVERDAVREVPTRVIEDVEEPPVIDAPFTVVGAPPSHPTLYNFSGDQSKEQDLLKYSKSLLK